MRRRICTDEGAAIAEFAIVLPALVLMAAAAFTAVSLVSVQVRLQNLAATAVRVVARGDALAGPLRVDLDSAGEMTVTLNGDLVSVRLDKAVRILDFPLTVSASAVARTEVSTNDFEQD